MLQTARSSSNGLPQHWQPTWTRPMAKGRQPRVHGFFWGLQLRIGLLDYIFCGSSHLIFQLLEPWGFASSFGSISWRTSIISIQVSLRRRRTIRHFDMSPGIWGNRALGTPYLSTRLMKSCCVEPGSTARLQMPNTYNDKTKTASASGSGSRRRRRGSGGT